MDKRIRGDSEASYSYKDMVDMFQQKLLPTHLRQVKVTMEIKELHQLPHPTVEELITHLSSLEKQRVTPPSDEVRREHLLGAVHAYLRDTQLLKNNLTASRLMTAGARALSIWQKKLAPHRWAGRRRSQCNTAVYKGSASHEILRVSVDQTRLHRRRTPVPGSGPADGNLGKSKVSSRLHLLISPPRFSRSGSRAWPVPSTQVPSTVNAYFPFSSARSLKSMLN